nr:hypothetical protein [Acidobacteriota bacterium]
PESRKLAYYRFDESKVPDYYLQAGKSFDVQVGPDLGHSGINQGHMMEFFLEHLVVRAPASSSTQ